MCGRYYFVYDPTTDSFLEEICSSISINTFAQGEIVPSMNCMVLILQEDKICADTRVWGIPSFTNKLVINARSESIHEKKMFIGLKRCIIVANGFFEWKQGKYRKDKIFIQKRNMERIFMAGLCDDQNFVILTGKAELQMKKVHPRTPLLISKEKVKDYLKGNYNPIVDNENLIFKWIEE